MFGLQIESPHDGYIGWRAILQRGGMDIPPHCSMVYGAREVRKGIAKWLDKPVSLADGKRKRSPWKRLLDWVEKGAVDPSSYVVFEVAEGGYVLRACPRASYGYLYIAAFRRIPKHRFVVEVDVRRRSAALRLLNETLQLAGTLQRTEDPENAGRENPVCVVVPPEADDQG